MEKKKNTTPNIQNTISDDINRNNREGKKKGWEKGRPVNGKVFVLFRRMIQKGINTDLNRKFTYCIKKLKILDRFTPNI